MVAVVSAWVAVLCVCAVLGAAVKAFLACDRFFVRQMDAAVGAGHHFGGLGFFRFLGRGGRVGCPTSLDGPYHHQDHHFPKANPAKNRQNNN